MARVSLLSKLLFGILTPTVLTFAGFAVLGHYAAARALEAELGRRLSGIAAVAATQIAEESVALLAAGDESSRTYRNLRRRLMEIRDASGVARVYVFAADLTARVDTNEQPIGTRYYELDSNRTELRQVFPPAGAKQPVGQSVSSLLFRGRDGRLYKSGYAPIAASPEQVVRFAVGVDGNAAIYADLLGLRKTLFWVGGGGGMGMVLLAVLLGLGLTRPLRRLLESARLIGSGVFDHPVPARAGGDEVAELGEGLETMRQALRARDERMQMMLSGIAHEVRNPLGGMELYAGLLAEELQTSGERAGPQAGPSDLPTMQGYVQRIRKELWHLQAVVNDFLDYARRPRPILMSVAAFDVLSEIRDNVSAKAPPLVTVASPRPEAPLYVYADATQLRRVLLNLAHNAVQACVALPPEDVRPRIVELTAQAATLPAGGAAVRFCVRDSGPGIGEDILPKIWMPFFTTRAQGTGLGLSFVREIVHDHGGSVEVHTSPVGTTFELILPARSPAERSEATPSSLILR